MKTTYWVEQIPNYPLEPTLGYVVSPEFTHNTIEKAKTFATRQRKLKKYRIYSITNHVTHNVVFELK
jgi:hypothetical protein